LTSRRRRISSTAPTSEEAGRSMRRPAPRNDRSQRRCAVRICLFTRHRFDAGKPHLAAILEAKAARIDDSSDAAFTLRFEDASRRDCRIGGGKHKAAWQCRHGKSDPAPRRTRHRFHFPALRHG
jgi:hypothetical protein